MKKTLLITLSLFISVNISAGETGGKYVRGVIIEGRWGSGRGEFGFKDNYPEMSVYPNAVAVNSRGDIYINDPANKRVLKFNSKGKYRSKIDMDRQLDGELLFMAVDSRENIYINGGMYDKNGKFIKEQWAMTDLEDIPFIKTGKGYAKLSSEGSFIDIPGIPGQGMLGKYDTYYYTVDPPVDGYAAFLVKYDLRGNILENINVDLPEEAKENKYILAGIRYIKEDVDENKFILVTGKKASQRPLSQFDYCRYIAVYDKKGDRVYTAGSLSYYQEEYGVDIASHVVADKYGNIYALGWNKNKTEKNDDRKEEKVIVIKWERK